MKARSGSYAPSISTTAQEIAWASAPAKYYTKPMGARTILCHYDLQGMLITETDASGSVLRDYLWANGQPAAQIEVSGAEEIWWSRGESNP